MLTRRELVLPVLQEDGTPGLLNLIDVSPMNHGQWLPGDTVGLDKVPPDDYNTVVLSMHLLHSAWYQVFAGRLHWEVAETLPNLTNFEMTVNPEGTDA